MENHMFCRDRVASRKNAAKCNKCNITDILGTLIRADLMRKAKQWEDGGEGEAVAWLL
ncbi:MAG TPA: hypothetical protein VF799_11730 [Geobacteraceae bacterium]